MTAKTLVWTFDSSPETGQPFPIAATCTEALIDGKHTDDEGRRMYINTHFLDVADAWKALGDNTEAHERACARDFRQAQTSLKAATQRLADVAAFATDVREARRKAGA